MTQTIYRPARRNQFTVISNGVMNDESISAEALGVLVYLLSRPDDWTIHRDQLMRRFDIGRDKFQSIFRELSGAGYARLVSVAGAEPGQLAGRRWVIIEEPAAEIRQRENPVVGSATEERVCRRSVEPTVGKPGQLINTDSRLNTDLSQKTDSPSIPQAIAAEIEREKRLCDEVRRESPIGPPFGQFMAAWKFDEASESITAAEREYDRLTPDQQAEAIRAAAALRLRTQRTVYASVWLRERRWVKATASTHRTAAPVSQNTTPFWIERGSPEWQAWEAWHSQHGGATMARNSDGTKRLIALQRGDAWGMWRPAQWPPDRAVHAA